MMKLFAAIIAVLFVLPTFAFQSETIAHDVDKDNLVKRGVVYLTTKEFKQESFTLELKYRISVSFLFINKEFKGVKNIELPTKYLEPYGYEELEEAGRIQDSQATMIHMGRLDLPNHYDCHKVKLIPRDSSKNWNGIFTYCSDIGSIGFARSQINMREIPYVGSHTVYSRIRK